MIDRAPAFLGLVYFAGILAFAWMPFPAPEALPTLHRFGEEFERLARLQRVTLLPLGVVTTMATMVALMRQGGFGAWRPRLQALALAALFATAFLTAVTAEPIEAAILEAARNGAADLVGPLLDRMERLDSARLVLAFVITAALVTAGRLPMAVARPGASALDSRQKTLLFLLGTATLFEGYDRFIAVLALPYIGRDLGASESTLGYALSLIRVGALGSIVLGRIADRHGRRRVLLFTVLAYTTVTAATGLSAGITAFVVFQFLATIFLMAELSLAQVVIAEEFPARFRSLGQGFLGAFAALGAGIAAMLFPIFQQTSLGWRGLYFVGLLPLLLVAWLRRALPETKRWQRAHDEGRTERSSLADLLAPALRGRFLLLLSVALVAEAALGPAFGFASYRAIRTFGWTPDQVSGMILVGGGLGMGGWFVFGTLAERLGRRPVGVVTVSAAGLAVLLYYGSEWLRTGFAAIVFAEAGMLVAVNALGTELFPTPLRSTAKTWITIIGILGITLGLAVVGVTATPLGGAEAAIRLLAVPALLAGPLVWWLPESRGRELEETADAAIGEPSPSAS